MRRMTRLSRSTDIDALGSLAEPVRRKLYEYAAMSGREVSRDEAAEAVGVNRSLAAFHLDKLVEAGLLEASYRRRSGKSGPGAGRPSKLYRRSARNFEVTLPERRHALLARLLTQGVAAGEARSSAGPGEATRAQARQLGRALGQEARAEAGPRAGTRRVLDALEHLLSANGFEPARSNGEIRLRNCPFHPVSRDYPQIVCAMNLSLMEGVLEGLRTRAITATLEPHTEMCCVVFRQAP